MEENLEPTIAISATQRSRYNYLSKITPSMHSLMSYDPAGAFIIMKYVYFYDIHTKKEIKLWKKRY